jgi:hypothetical protein
MEADKVSDSHEKGDDQREDSQKAKRGLSWPVKALLLSLALLAGLFEHALGRWAGPTAMAAIAVIVPVLLFQRFWRQTWFWITAVLLGVAQVPVVIAVRPLIEQARSFYMLSFVMIDGLLVIAVISLVCPKSNDGHA